MKKRVKIVLAILLASVIAILFIVRLVLLNNDTFCYRELLEQVSDIPNAEAIEDIRLFIGKNPGSDKITVKLIDHTLSKEEIEACAISLMRNMDKFIYMGIERKMDNHFPESSIRLYVESIDTQGVARCYYGWRQTLKPDEDRLQRFIWTTRYCTSDQTNVTETEIEGFYTHPWPN